MITSGSHHHPGGLSSTTAAASSSSPLLIPAHHHHQIAATAAAGPLNHFATTAGGGGGHLSPLMNHQQATAAAGKQSGSLPLGLTGNQPGGGLAGSGHPMSSSGSWGPVNLLANPLHHHQSMNQPFQVENANLPKKMYIFFKGETSLFRGLLIIIYIIANKSQLVA